MNMWQSIRKFGLGHCNLKTMLWNVDILLRVLTLRIDMRNPNKVSIWFYVLTIICASCYFYVYLISMAWFVFFKSVETGDFLAGIIVFSLGVSSEIGPMKLICMFVYEKQVRDIVSQCLASDALVPPSTRFSNNLMKSLRVVKRRAMIFWIVVIGNAVAYIGKPILMPGRHTLEDVFVLYGLDPTFESPHYEITFLVMAIGSCVCVYLPANITAFLIIISGYIESQMLAWSEELLHLWEDVEQANEHSSCLRMNTYYVSSATLIGQAEQPNDLESDVYLNKAAVPSRLIRTDSDHKCVFTSTSIDNKNHLFIEQRLKIIIKGHSTNINLLKQIEHVFRGALAVEFGLLVIGLIAELLGGLENTWIEIPFAMMQVAMDCLTGQRLIDASRIFERSVYDCKWENFDVKNKKIVLVMLLNSQKELRLTAGGVTTLNFVSLMSVIRSIYSAYTTLSATIQ